MQRTLLLALLLSLHCLVLSPALFAETAPQDASEASYQLPDQALVDMIDRPPTPSVQLSPDQQWMLLVQAPNLPAIAELAEEELRLAGIRFKPQNNGPSRRMQSIGLALQQVADGTHREITGLPSNPRLSNFAWSGNGTHFAFTQTQSEGIELWVGEVATGKARRLVGPPLSLVASIRPQWIDDEHLLFAQIPENRGSAPERPPVPSGPVIQENLGEKAPARTYQDLLADAHDGALFAHYLTTQLATVSLGGTVQTVGEPDLLWGVEASPSGEYLLVETLERPFSYLVTARRFPKRVEILSRKGEVVRTIAKLPLQEKIPVAFGSVATGPRSFDWRADSPAALIWAEALDGGDAGKEATLRDRLFVLDAPFTGEPTAWTDLKLRFGGVSWGNGDMALVSEWWWKTRQERTSRVRPDQLDAEPQLIHEGSWEDRYNDPGSPVMTRNQDGNWVLWIAKDGKTLYRIGAGASPEGDRPFLDAWDVDSGKTKRLFRSEAPYYERPMTLLKGAGHSMSFLTRRESIDEPPNYFRRTLGKKKIGEAQQLTHFEHPTPELRGLSKELIRYTREDGVELTGTLYLPPGYDQEKDGPLPTLLWAYPQEFKSADAAGQVTDSPYRFARIGWWSPLLWLAEGYAVLDDPSMPIIGEGDVEPNDAFREQLVGSAKAAVDEIVRRGVADPDRLAVGGHSYGAFMTANLLAHSDLFAAGIARSGAYNRTLTPFGFQSEERTYWEAPEVYFEMSPFMHAEKVNEPILLIHGAADNNSGTFPMQSERYYNALKGHGATARLVMLPHESHGYRARESVLHMLWETERWLEMFVRDPASPEDQFPQVEAGGPIGAQP